MKNILWKIREAKGRAIALFLCMGRRAYFLLKTDQP
jgi:hypothetical protein